MLISFATFNSGYGNYIICWSKIRLIACIGLRRHGYQMPSLWKKSNKERNPSKNGNLVVMMLADIIVNT